MASLTHTNYACSRDHENSFPEWCNLLEWRHILRHTHVKFTAPCQSLLRKYPGGATKVVISIKGPIRGDQQNVQRTIDECLRIPDGKKHLDIFQCARVDPRTPIEETIEAIARYIEQGKLSGISLSEAKPEFIRRAAAVHQIACVEVEFSLFATEIMHNGVGQTCSELGIPIIAYSPLGRGFLTGHAQRADVLAEGDIRKAFPRTQPGNFEKNMKLVNEVAKVAAKKSCSISQVALAWG